MFGLPFIVEVVLVFGVCIAIAGALFAVLLLPREPFDEEALDEQRPERE
ncbi:hypothetical protein J2W34_000074 [Variovorax boronicumulans]|nr:hypothetical protein [Variovorax boronicumulans]MDQ0068300.1 hypothetical protein [Variovorax boronicumulans]